MAEVPSVLENPTLKASTREQNCASLGGASHPVPIRPTLRKTYLRRAVGFDPDVRHARERRAGCPESESKGDV